MHAIEPKRLSEIDKADVLLALNGSPLHDRLRSHFLCEDIEGNKPSEGHRYQILDHGYLTLVESYGADHRIIEAARMSTGKGFEGWGGEPCPHCLEFGRLSDKDFLFRTYADSETARKACVCKGSGKVIGDEKLLRYLYENKHHTPFEMAGAIIEVQAPIMVFREWHRHRTQSYNEMSARYVPLPAVNYVPTVARLMINSKKNKQAGVIDGAEQLTVESADAYRLALAAAYDSDEAFYQKALQSGVPKELARLHLPVGRYSRMRANANLRNWLLFLTLRMDKAAQWEIRQFANAMYEVLAKAFPRTMELYVEHQHPPLA